MSVLVRAEQEEGAPDGKSIAAFQEIANALAARELMSGEYLIDLIYMEPADMRRTNLQHRGVDKTTDVLSFPACAYPGGIARDNPEAARACYDSDEGRWFLGDLIICPKRAARQAAAFGHSLNRELCYLFAHGMCHLLGYDHISKKQKAAMRAAEESALSALCITRE
ncbi:MAG: rRNA maturation RNase YbeY [Oscillospiraceae bacterium]|nr:rRNA maturation RNase YbeY [Oscillospiraceae bacterium]